MGVENKFKPVQNYWPTGRNGNFDRIYQEPIRDGFVVKGERPEIIAMSQRETGPDAIMQAVEPIVWTVQEGGPFTFLLKKPTVESAQRGNNREPILPM